MTSYVEKIKQAYAFTKSLSMYCEEPVFDLDKQYFKNIEERNAFMSELNLEFFGFDSILFLQGKCHVLAAYIKPFIEEKLNCKAYYTVGGCRLSDGSYNYRLTKDMAERLAKGQSSSEIRNTHAWLTLDNGEVLDVTAFATAKFSKFLWDNKIHSKDLMHKLDMEDKSHPAVLRFENYTTSTDIAFGFPGKIPGYQIHPTVIGESFMTYASPSFKVEFASFKNANSMYELHESKTLNATDRSIIQNFFNVRQ